MSRAHRLAIPSLLLCLASWCVPVVHAGVVNPDISVVGQPVASWTNDADRTAEYRRVTFGVGETELVLDAALNPYARGFVNVSIADGQANIEEAYFTLLRGLPAGLELKGGRYRVGFGKLNAAHPHTYPFIERFHVLAKLLPGADADAAEQVAKKILKMFHHCHRYPEYGLASLFLKNRLLFLLLFQSEISM